jgi:hypothetical protein
MTKTGNGSAKEFLGQHTCVMEPKFAETLKAMASAEIQFKSPLSPPDHVRGRLFFKGGVFPRRLNPSLTKRGKGRFV